MGVRRDEPGHETEWPGALDVRALLEGGWRPTPIRDFILKVHSRCNLACDYCYMYEMADQGWRRQPRRMSRQVVAWAAQRIAEHARANLLPEVEVVLHGGEPLLAGAEHLRYAIETIRAAGGSDVRVGFGVQTNGVLLDEMFLDLFAEHGVSVGVSVDGDEEGHDLHRRRANGRGSYQDVRTGLERLTGPRYRHLFGGLLSTIELRNDPIATYEALLEFRPPEMDFLLPHGNWDAPPPGRPADESTPYGDWLIAIFDRWYAAEAGDVRVRLFSEIMRLLFGRMSASEAVGLSPVAVAVVETNGEIEQVDSLKSAYDGAAGTRLHVSRDPFDTVLSLPSVVARQIGRRALSEQCLACEAQEVCGGGLYPHRYRSGTGFRNPSVYCRDLLKLITHIRDVLSRDLAARPAATVA
ncbi:FxsB family cyclophane-forming radical SAM/SPASM peptide maturase [Actinomadura opuntiae]|uniref:FxsB family cyclophane-forming radical SAM/SPASM peptide maturase n=1 Tax=Actinomadura sp. OS1-43 TaxID=604315 RepID=UPI00255ACD8E|nr:FxsB family cyclophane-forming radical SAM/SPASM peptide maturase [Actinomadura sp. OS1-43]MDL4814586.1 FxsB family cyclophane-forming radical SAM/SPASM peptide maturase [Actinomadura sp. OS1-43]